MNSSERNGWPKANQDYLMAAVGVVRATLERHARLGKGEAGNDDSHQKAELDLQEAAGALPAPSALEILSGAFRLSSFERDVLVLCAGVELDSSFAFCCGEAQGGGNRRCPTFSLALAALPEAHWSALSPLAPLRRWRLIELTSNEGLVSAPLHIDERVLHFLTGVNTLDDRLQGLVEPISAPPELPPSHLDVAKRIAALWTNKKRETPSIVQLCGERGTARIIAGAAAKELGLGLFGIRYADIPSAAVERDSLARLWEREAMLGNSALLVDAQDADPAECARTLLPFLENVNGVLFVSRREPLRPWGRPIVRFDVQKPTFAEQKVLWQQALGEVSQNLNGKVDNVIAQFNLNPSGIAAVCAELTLRGADEKNLERNIWEACRVQSRTPLDDLAQRIQPAAKARDLILPVSQRQTLREIAAHVRQRTKVYETWGFAEKSERGLGISALFAGSSGTGKTMAAEVLARVLRLDLYRIDLSRVVSKYIGETKKNLGRVFDAAEEGGAILLFDEADALFGKRSEVKDSHDRYANLEVSYLLQRMETYRGLAILTTNRKDALDPAFLRRLRFVVQFPFPDTAQRARIWKRIFPSRTPTEALDVKKLSRLNVPGGNIRNVALNAAFLAAKADKPVGMTHLARAARSEYAKLEKPLIESEIGGWT